MYRQRNIARTQEEEQMERGVIKKYFPEKGYGFVQPDFGDSDLFVHIREVSPGVVPRDGDRCVYEVAISKRTGRPVATNVKIIAAGVPSYGRF
jgi:CspA family cold shock protein